jgi:hypothetical protein
LDYRAVIVASEPFSDKPWHEFPDESMLVVDERIEPQLRKIAGRNVE